MRTPRRRLIKTVPAVAIGIAGCLSGDNEDSETNDNYNNKNTERPDSDRDDVPDINDDYSNDPSRSEQLRSISDTRNLEEDTWWYYTLNFTRTGAVEYDFIVRDGPAIDVILLDRSEYKYFEGDGRYQYYTGISVLDSTGDNISGQVSAGTYRLIFDNSNRGSATPPTNFSNDVISVEFSVNTSQ